MKYIFLSLIFFLSFFTVSGQNTPAYLVKYGMVVKLAENIDWPEKYSDDFFTIGVIEKEYNDTLSSIYTSLEKTHIHGKSVRVKKIDKLRNVSGLNLLYINADLPPSFKELFDKLSHENVLVITNEVEDKKLVMINFYVQDQKVKFEINKPNIINAGLSIKPKLILLGGTEIDVADLFQDTQDDLDRQKVKVSHQEHELEAMRKEIDQKRKEIDKQKDEIKIQKEEIESKKNKIREQNKNLAALYLEIKKQEELLNEKVKLFEIQEEKLKTHEQEIKEKEAIIGKRNNELEGIGEQIRLQEEQLALQKLRLIKQYSIIELQKNLIYVFIAFLVLVLFVAFLIYRGYKNQKNFSRKVAEKNEEISYQKEELQVQTENLNKANMEIEQLYGELKDSLKAAHLIQESIMPSTNQIRQFLPNIFLFNKPKDVVSGDFYWFDVKEDHIVVAVADCTGHGVSGALMSMMGHHLLKQSVHEAKNLCASEILNLLNNKLIKELHQKENIHVNDGMDIALCMISPDKRKLFYAGANIPLYIIRNNSLIEVKADRYPIGFIYRGNIKTFTSHEVNLEEGDMIYLFSDGYADQFGGPKGEEKFMYPRFRDLLVKIGKEDVEFQQKALEKNLEKWRGITEQIDDILIMGFRV